MALAARHPRYEECLNKTRTQQKYANTGHIHMRAYDIAE